MTRPPKAATAAFDAELERLRRLAGLQVDTVARAVQGVGDTTGWARLTALGTQATVDAQHGAKAATTRYLEATLEAAGVPSAGVSVPIQPGLTVSGRPVSGMFAATQGVVTNRMSGGDTFDEALDHSAKYLVGQASSEPHRIGRDGQLSAGLTDDRFGRFRRVAEPGACDFCRMLATRGAVYLTAQTAGQGRKYHAHDRCMIELVVSEQAIARSKSLSKDWRNAISDEDRMRRAGAMRDLELPEVPVAAPPTGPAWERLPKLDSVDAATPRKALEDARRELRALEDASPEFTYMPKSELVRRGPEGRAFLLAQNRIGAKWDLAELELMRAEDPIYRAAVGANPNYAPGTRTSVNCTHVVQAVELRRRGFDVIASELPEPFTVGRSAEDALAEWAAPGGTPRKFTVVDPLDVEFEAQKWPEGARGWVQVQWDTGGAHIYNVERTPDGVRFIEGQKNGDVDAAAGYLSRAGHSKAWIVRVDDLTPTDDVLKYLDTAPTT